MAIVQVSIKTTEVETQRLGYIGLSLTNMLNSTEPLIASGSVIEIGSSLYEINSNTDIDPAGDLAGISNGNMIWMYIDSDTLTSKVTTTEPIWSEEKQAWYDSGEDHRYYACMFKDNSGNYTNKQIMGGRFWQPEIFITDDYTVSDEFINMKIILAAAGPAANKTVTLPTLADNLGKKISIENRNSSYYITIDGEGAEDIQDELATCYLLRLYQNVTLKGNSTTWQIIEGSVFDNTAYQSYTRTAISQAGDAELHGYSEFFSSMIRYYTWGFLKGDGVNSLPTATFTIHRALTNTSKINVSGTLIGRRSTGTPSGPFDNDGYLSNVIFSGIRLISSSLQVGVIETNKALFGATISYIFSLQIESEL